MISLSFDILARMTDGTLREALGAERTFAGVSIDSRTINAGELFIAVRGERVDGHDYIPQAIERGAAGVVSETTHARLGDIPSEVPTVTVHDSHEAMMLLAERHRESFRAKFVGITGSNGKTTTKELAWRLISAVEQDVYRSPGNLNNLYGMPLSLFAMPEQTRVAVMEMGISMPGEMTRLTRIVKPDVILISNIGPSHLQFLGSVEGVARAKLEMVAGSHATTPVIINGDDALLVRETKKLRSDFVTFGIDTDATYRPDSISTDDDGRSIVVIEEHAFKLPLFGRYQVYNLLAAYAACRALDYTFDGVDTASIELATAPMRGEIISSGGVTFIADCYNANPDSMRSGLKSFASWSGERRRVIILGDMLELGESEAEYHRELGRQVAGLPCDLLVTVGPLSKHLMDEAVTGGLDRQKALHFASAGECAGDIRRLLHEGDLVFIKGSRGIGLEAIIKAWTESEGNS